MLETLKGFFETSFNGYECFDCLDHIIHFFKKDEYYDYRTLIITDLYHIIQTKNYKLADKIIRKYGERKFDNLDEVERFIKYLYDKFTDRPTDVVASDFMKKIRCVFCPFCTPDSEADGAYLCLIYKATIIENNQQIYLCKRCRSMWLSDSDLSPQAAKSYKLYMKELGLPNVLKELRDIDFL